MIEKEHDREVEQVENINQAISAILRQRQAYPKVTDTQVAEISGVAVHQIRRLLKGERRFHVDEFEAIALALGMAPADVISRAYERISEQTRRIESERDRQSEDLV